jgi:hypothetical protein
MDAAPLYGPDCVKMHPLAARRDHLLVDLAAMMVACDQGHLLGDPNIAESDVVHAAMRLHQQPTEFHVALPGYVLPFRAGDAPMPASTTFRQRKGCRWD